MFRVIIANVSTTIPHLAWFLTYSPVHSFLSLCSGIKRALQFTGGSPAGGSICLCQASGLFRAQNACYPSHFALQKALGVQCPPLTLPFLLPAERWTHFVAGEGPLPSACTRGAALSYLQAGSATCRRHHAEQEASGAGGSCLQ